MRRVLAASAMALMIGGGWAAPAMAEQQPETDRITPDTASESVSCAVKFMDDTKVREIPYADSAVLGVIPADTWADGAWCIPLTLGGHHTTCAQYSDIWVAVDVDDTWGFAHVGCMNDYYLH
ncbi:hypothetical protein AB0A73_08105 [Glycomyces sp. NPDC047369]